MVSMRSGNSRRFAANRATDMGPFHRDANESNDDRGPILLCVTSVTSLVKLLLIPPGTKTTSVITKISKALLQLDLRQQLQ